jgi:hypothetical protein
VTLQTPVVGSRTIGVVVLGVAGSESAKRCRVTERAVGAHRRRVGIPLVTTTPSCSLAAAA